MTPHRRGLVRGRGHGRQPANPSAGGGRGSAVAALAAAGLALALSACAMEEYTPPPDPTPASSAAAAGETGLQVLSPAEGDSVALPFTVTVETSVELGAAEDGLHHVHVWFGEDQEGTTTMHYGDSAEITDAPAGDTAMWVQVADSEHGLLGEPVEVPVTIEASNEDSNDAGNEDTGGDTGGDTGDGEEDPGYTY